MLKSQNYKRSRDEKNLVADQPGRRIFLIGLLIAGFIGFSLRGLLSQERVTTQIELAAQNVHKDLKINFAESFVRLSEGGIPRFEVVIKQILIQSENLCWNQPLLSIDEMRIPLSITAAILGEPIISSLEINRADLRLKGELRSCYEGNPINKNQTTVASSKADLPAVSIVSSRAGRFSNEINFVHINRLSVFHEKYPQAFFELGKLDFNVKSVHPKFIDFQAVAHFLKDSRGQDFSSSGNLRFEYKEFPESEWKIFFAGHMREGTYDMQLSYNLATQEYKSELILSHIPVSQILELTEGFGVSRVGVIPKQVWISGNLKSKSTLLKNKQIPLSISGLQMEGDIGVIRTENLDFVNIRPLELNTVELNLTPLDLDYFSNIQDVIRLPGFINKLGKLNGFLKFDHAKGGNLSAKLSGVEFAFAQFGQKAIQRIENLQMNVGLKDQRWTLEIPGMEIQDGNFAGNLKLEGSRDLKDLSCDLRIDKLQLSPQVETQLTRGGRLGSMQLVSKLKWKNLKLFSASSQMLLNNGQIDLAEFSKLNLNFEYANGEGRLNIQARDGNVLKQGGMASNLIEKVFPTDTYSYPLKLTGIQGVLLSTDFGNFRWKDVHWTEQNSNANFYSKGYWTPTAQVSGEILVLRKGKRNLYKLSGTREMPLISKE